MRILIDIVSDCLRLSQICTPFAHHLQITGQGSALRIVEHDAWTSHTGNIEVYWSLLKSIEVDEVWWGLMKVQDQINSLESFSLHLLFQDWLCRILGRPVKDIFPLKLLDHFNGIVFQGENKEETVTVQHSSSSASFALLNCCKQPWRLLRRCKGDLARSDMCLQCRAPKTQQNKATILKNTFSIHVYMQRICAYILQIHTYVYIYIYIYVFVHI